jgi:hypothetical protein
MFNRRKKSKKNSRRKPILNLPSARRARLGVEPLETRDMFSGTVNILIAPAAGLNPGALVLVGDNAGDQVVMTQSTSSPGTFTLSSSGGTEFQVNGSGITMTSATVNGINGEIVVDLANGNTSFQLNGASASGQALLGGLEILNGNGNDSVTLQNIEVLGNLPTATAASLLIDNSPAKVGDLIDTAPANIGNGSDTLTATNVTVVGNDGVVLNNGGGSNTASLTSLDVTGGGLQVLNQSDQVNTTNLTITSSTIAEQTMIDNIVGGAGAGANSSVTVSSSQFYPNQPISGVSGPSFVLTNNLAPSVLQVTGATTTFGVPIQDIGGVVPGVLPTAVQITNENTTGVSAGTQINFAVANGDTTGPTVYGSVSISNGQALPGSFNNTSFTDTTVLGGVQVANGTAAGSKGFSTSEVSLTGPNGTSTVGIGTQLAEGGITAAGAQMGTLVGGVWSVAVNNGPGPDTFSMSNLNAPYGVALFNGGSNNAATIQNWGSTSTISGSTIGSNITPSGLAHDALDIGLDNGINVVNVNSGNTIDQNVRIGALLVPITGANTVTFSGGTTTVAGTVDFIGGSGVNNFTFSAVTAAGLTATSTGGSSTVTIQGSTVTNTIDLDFGGATGTNTVKLLTGTGGTVDKLPSTLYGSVVVMGPIGADNTLDYEAADIAAEMDLDGVAENFQTVNQIP